MTKDEMLAVIRERCIEANPEIVSLEVGSIVESKSPSGTHTGTILSRGINEYGNDYVTTTWGGFAVDSVGNPMSPYVNILGRPIQLSDVLMRLEDFDPGFVYAVSGDGTFMKIHSSTETGLLTYESTGIIWSLQLPLSQQSPETIEFIYNIVK